MATAVVYYSFGGTCALAAKALAEKLGAKLVELKECKPRPHKINFITMGFQAAFGVGTRLSGDPAAQVADCGTLHVLTPVWASSLTPAVRSFLSETDLKGKRVHLYAVMADPSLNVKKIQAAAQKLVSAAGGTLVGAKGVLGAAPGKPPRQEAAADIRALAL